MRRDLQKREARHIDHITKVANILFSIAHFKPAMRLAVWRMECQLQKRVNIVFAGFEFSVYPR